LSTIALRVLPFRVMDVINAEGDRATWQTLQSVRTTTVLDSIKVAKRNPEIERFSTLKGSGADRGIEPSQTHRRANSGRRTL
jgi:hypothetical protein